MATEEENPLAAPDPGRRSSSISTCVRLLTFRISREELLALDLRHLAFGFACTWVVGMGRWWDDPEAGVLQRLGVGSLSYVFVLAGIIWLVALPLRPLGWGYRRVLTFVCLTSPPAILYAVPVERFMALEAADQWNFRALAVVAAWRVALLLFFLMRLGRLTFIESFVAGTLPLAGIVSALVALNLHRVVFNIMGGVRDHEKTAHDAAYGFLFMLQVLSVVGLPVFLLLHGINVVRRKRDRIDRGDGREESEDFAAWIRRQTDEDEEESGDGG